MVVVVKFIKEFDVELDFLEIYPRFSNYFDSSDVLVEI